MLRPGTGRFRPGEDLSVSFETIIPFLKPIEHLRASPIVSEIMVNPDGCVWIDERIISSLCQVAGLKMESC
jgi:Flp pilus assembly CpaF family ATPase